MEFIIAVGKFILAYSPQLAGVIIPPIVDWLNREVHSEQEKFIVTLLVCGVFAVAFKWNELMMGSSDQIFSSFTLIFIESQIVYKLYFKSSGLRVAFLDRIKPEEETTPAPVQPTNEASK